MLSVHTCVALQLPAMSVVLCLTRCLISPSAPEGNCIKYTNTGTLKQILQGKITNMFCVQISAHIKCFCAEVNAKLDLKFGAT